MGRFHSSIEAPESGWMRFRFHGGGGEIDITASSTPRDSFYDFVTAIQATYEHGTTNVVRFNEEPREIELTLARSGECLIISTHGLPEDSQIKLSFETGCREIARNIYHLLQQVGYDGFISSWGHRPPKERIKEFWGHFQPNRP